MPTKFSIGPGTEIKASHDRKELSGGSVLIATLIARWYSKIIPLCVRGRVLDLGCGKAPLYGAYSVFADDVLCTDWPPSVHGDFFLDFASDLNCGIPLSDRSVDTVILSDVLEHIYNPRLLLEEIHRVLKPGGQLILNAPFLYWIHEQPHDFYRYTPFAISRMAADTGLRVKDLDSIGGPLLLIADTIGKLVQTIPLAGPRLAYGIQRAILFFHQRIPTSNRYPLVVAAVLSKDTR